MSLAFRPQVEQSKPIAFVRSAFASLWGAKKRGQTGEGLPWLEGALQPSEQSVRWA